MLPEVLGPIRIKEMKGERLTWSEGAEERSYPMNFEASEHELPRAVHGCLFRTFTGMALLWRQSHHGNTECSVPTTV
jgi:hypothetical protein